MTNAQIKKHYKKIGKKGGKKIAERGSDYFRELQKKAVDSRKKKLSTDEKK